MIKIGTPLTLVFSQPGEEMKYYHCKIIEQSKNFIFIDYPINEANGRTGIFELDSEFLASFVGNDGSVYQFPTILKEKKKLNIPSLKLHYPGRTGLKRIQRREYVRIESAVDTAVHDVEGSFPPFTTITYDISGGGISIILPEGHQIEKQTKLDIWLVLPMESDGYKYIYVSARSIRTTEDHEGKKRILSLEFEDIEDKDRQLVIRYCFERQLRERRRTIN